MVSIVIVNHNRKEDLKACLNSVQKTKYKNFEVIVIDNASTDGSVEIVKKNFRSVKLVVNDQNVGPIKARNFGVQISKGSLIAFLDSDTEVEPNWLIELVKVISSDKKVGACACKVKFFSNKNLINSAGMGCDKYGFAFSRGLICRGTFEKDEGQYDKQEEVFSAYTAAMLAKKDVLKEINLFNQELGMYYEDIELSWKIRLAGYKIIYVPTSVVFHKMAPSKTPFTTKVKYYTERNRLITMIQNYSLPSLIRLMPFYLFLKFSESMIYLSFNKPDQVKSIINALIHTLNKLPKISYYRRQTQKIRKVDDKDIAKFMERYSKELSMYLGGYGKFVLD